MKDKYHDYLGQQREKERRDRILYDVGCELERIADALEDSEE